MQVQYFNHSSVEPNNVCEETSNNKMWERTMKIWFQNLVLRIIYLLKIWPLFEKRASTMKPVWLNFEWHNWLIFHTTYFIQDISYNITGCAIISEVDIDIDVQILQFLLILSCYWYCRITKWVIDIDIDIAKGCYPISLLILILQ